MGSENNGRSHADTSPAQRSSGLPERGWQTPIQAETSGRLDAGEVGTTEPRLAHSFGTMDVGAVHATTPSPIAIPPPAATPQVLQLAAVPRPDLAALIAANPPASGETFAVYGARISPLQVFQDLKNLHNPQDGEKAQSVQNFRAEYDIWVLAHKIDRATALLFMQADGHAPAQHENENAYAGMHADAIDAFWRARDPANWSINDDWAGATEAVRLALQDYHHQQQQAEQDRVDAEQRLDAYHAALAPDLRRHVFEGEVNGANEAIGLHAYTNGQLPGGIVVLETHGDPAGVHLVVWTTGAADTNNKCKWSSMFPSTIPRGMAAWHLLHRTNVDAYPTNTRVDAAPFAWGQIEVGTAGATAFPTYAGVASTAQLVATFPGSAIQWEQANQRYTLQANGKTYRVTN